jgi:GxxExxY protein
MTDNLLYGDITAAINDCYHLVFNPLSSPGLSKVMLQKAMVIELQKHGLRVQQNVTVTHRYDNRKIGSGKIDLAVNGKVAVAIKHQTEIRERDKAKLRSCMLDGGYAVGLLLNFGNPRPKTVRVYEATHAPRPGSEV